MLLTITTTYNPATDLGYLLHKNPIRCQSFPLSFGKVHVFYPEASIEKCTAAMLLDIDPVDMVRGRRGASGMPLDQYVNDRPYVASSFLSVAIAQVFGTAMKGVCKQRPDLGKTVMPLSARISVLPCRGGEGFLHRLFEPLGYEIKATQHILNDRFPEWEMSPYYTVQLEKTTTLSELLTHLYVLVPVLDNHKHYYIDSAELEKLLLRGEGWLANHPEKETITRRYLKYKASLAREALARLNDEIPLEEASAEERAAWEEEIERVISLDEERLGTVLSVLKSSGAKSIIDLGCGEGRLLKLLLKEKQFARITGMDVSIRALEIAHERLRLESLPAMQRARIELIHGSLMYRDRRFEGYDAASVVEVIEHLDPPRLAAFERVLFECARPGTIVLTTPNREYNVTWETVGADGLRHSDHRFEWTRAEFREWAGHVAGKFGYDVRFLPVGREDKDLGAPTQMAVFEKR